MSSNQLQPNTQVVVRPVRPSDANAVFTIANDPLVKKSIDLFPFIESAPFSDWLAKPVDGQYRFTAESNGRVVGFAILKNNTRPRINHSGDLILIVRPDCRRRGVGKALAKTLLDLADNWLNLKRLQVDVPADNKRALRFLKQLDFQLEGIGRRRINFQGQYLDEITMSRIRGFEIDQDSYLAEQDQINISPSNSRTLHLRRGQNSRPEATIRPLELSDRDDLYEMFRHSQVCRTTLQLTSQEPGSYESRYHDRHPGLIRLVAEVQQQVVGSISLRQLQSPRRLHVGQIGMAVHPDFWGLGLGSQLMGAIVDLSENKLNLKRIELLVNKDNVRGIRLYQKFGFDKEGIKRLHAYGDGRWSDSYCMARLI